jgi:DNA-directed RNA polymerase subunit H (RpoH/RPB5)
MAPTDALVQRLGEIHHTVHNNGQRTLECILKTCSEMFCDRGAVRTTTGQDDSGFVVHGWDQNDEESMRVHLCTEDRIGVRLARTLLEAADGLPLVLVSIEGPTPFTRRECASQRVQFFNANTMCVNVSRHQLVPRHQRIDKAPYSLDPEHLPCILEGDSVVQYYNWPVGTIVKIDRVFGGSEPVPYYRVVGRS